eukprot:TRINITY_DN2890_c0_g2_i2.p2 TRINITY_DN2890_c0_g2~~TRINITY_DN2890_c0_g2_i2.p2  ORF type:complete len:347 (+),score=26.93 TRINITY_DN2890_c0_g2_i2:130-1170(+)
MFYLQNLSNPVLFQRYFVKYSEQLQQFVKACLFVKFQTVVVMQGGSQGGVLQDPLLAGEHCNVAECKQIDFLPFKCDCCHKVFCLEHRQYEEHKCPLAQHKVLEVVPCPLCAKGIKLTRGTDPNEQFEIHLREGCDPGNYRKVHKKKKCPVDGCRERLTETGSYSCQKCGQKTCLKHRHPEDHACKATRKQNSTSSIATIAGSIRQKSGNLIMDSFRALGVGTRAPKLTPKAPTPKRQTPHQPQPAIASATEQCPQCGAGFSNVQQLVSHVQQVHERTGNQIQNNTNRQQSQQQQQRVDQPLVRTRRQNQGQGTEVCPVCNARFVDVVQLVSHVERLHQQTSRVSS